MRDLWTLFYTFLKIGSFTFGGGYAMIPAIRRETVQKRGWIDEEGITDCMAVSQSLPGAFAVNVSIFIGKRVKGLGGAITASLGLVLPAYLSILLILIILGSIEGNNPYVYGAFEGIKAASVALILATTIQIAMTVMNTWYAKIAALLSFVAIVFLSINAVYAILAGGLAGFFIYKLKERKEKNDTP